MLARRRATFVALSTVLCAVSLWSAAASAAPPIPATPELAEASWGISLPTLEKLLHRKLTEQATPGDYDSGKTTIYGIPATLTLEVGAVDGLRGATLHVNAGSAPEVQEQMAFLHGKMEAEFGRPVADDQSTNSSGKVTLNGVEWRWSDGSVLVLPQPDNQIYIFYAETASSHETLALTKQELDNISPGTARRFKWALNGRVWIVHRTQDMIRSLDDHALLADPGSSAYSNLFLKLEIQGRTPVATQAFLRTDQRSINSEYGVFRDVAPLEGCVLLFKDDSPATRSEVPAIAQLGDRWHGGFYDACKSVAFDSAGRAYKNSVDMPNLIVPEYSFRADGSLVIGHPLNK